MQYKDSMEQMILLIDRGFNKGNLYYCMMPHIYMVNRVHELKSIGEFK